MAPRHRATGAIGYSGFALLTAEPRIYKVTRELFRVLV